MNIKKLKQDETINELLEFGIINIDKPSGPTSFDVSNFVKKTLKLRKTSHFGTLDPKVTGVLPVALNRACKLTGYFLRKDKEYIGIMRIHEETPIKKIEKVIKEKFTGKIIQLPPVKSRVKRQERQREIKKFEIFGKKDKDISFKVECEAGTYIRKLIHDLGDYMKIGAHMLELRRIRAGIFHEKDSIKINEFEEAVEAYKNGKEEPLRNMIIPAEIISDFYSIIQIKKDNLEKIFTGKPIHKKDLAKKETIKKDEVVCVFMEERFVGMFKVINGEEVFAKPEFVMQPIG